MFNVNRGRVYRVAPGGVEVTRQPRPSRSRSCGRCCGWTQGDLFVASRLGAIEGAITQIYRTQGFATAEVDSAVNEIGDGLVKPVIIIKEGPRVVVGDVAVSRQHGDSGRSAARRS